jgi:hypothetical protein
MLPKCPHWYAILEVVLFDRSPPSVCPHHSQSPRPGFSGASPPHWTLLRPPRPPQTNPPYRAGEPHLPSTLEKLRGRTGNGKNATTSSSRSRSPRRSPTPSPAASPPPSRSPSHSPLTEPRCGHPPCGAPVECRRWCQGGGMALPCCCPPPPHWATLNLS